mgnify:CR=1 FL=1
MNLWYCVHCGEVYAHVPDGDTDWHAKSGCCSKCPPYYMQNPAMVSFDRSHIPFDLQTLTLQLLGEIRLYERLNNVTIPSVQHARLQHSSNGTERDG